MGLAVRIPPESTCFRTKTRPLPFPRAWGAACSPLLYPGNAPPPGTPALQVVKKGYTFCHGRETARFSAVAENFSARYTFWAYGGRFV